MSSRGIEQINVSSDRSQRIWQLLSALGSAHVNALHQEGVFDEEAADALLATIESVAHGAVPGGLLELSIAFDDRVDGLCAPRLVGVVRLGRGTAETVGAVARIITREQVARVAGDACDLIDALLQLAEAHVVTMLPAYAGSQPVQPTTLAHYLGAAIGPLGRGIDRLLAALEAVNLSPLGAAAMASSRFAPDRGSTASMLGFAGPVPNTFDAVVSTDYFDAVAAAAESMLAPIEGILREVSTWIRTSPDSIVFDDDQVGRIPDLPQLRIPETIDLLLELTGTARAGFGAVRAWTREAGYGPQLRLDQPLDWLADSMEAQTQLYQQSARFFSAGFEVNRAVFGNRAGRGHVTSSDLAEFLIVEEEIAPGDARIIAGRVLAMIRDKGLEISAIDRETIDAAGLLVLGREIGIEFETLSKYLAPRRFLEQRTADGAPAPNAIRAWLKQENDRLAERKTAIDEYRTAWNLALGEASEDLAPH
jgi:argininosuccinate lyase